MCFRKFALLAALACVAYGAPSVAAAQTLSTSTQEAPLVTLELRDTLDIWRNLSGGVTRGYTSLDKLQFAASLHGEALGRPGFVVHAELFKTNGESLSGSRTGDIQTVSNVEALSALRLFQLWAEQRLRLGEAHSVTVRAGLTDLNASFDSIAPASLFLNSSHGIGPDISKSGRSGPSIFPVSSLGAQASWAEDDVWTVTTAIFDGVPGDPAHPKAFVSVNFGRDDGALLIAQTDRKLGNDGQVSVGLWRYTGSVPSIRNPSQLVTGRPGLYAFVEGPFVGASRGWLRAGVADGRVQPVSAYLGGGLVWPGFLPGRSEDQVGIAVAHAVISPQSRRQSGLPRAETTFEATYSYTVNPGLSLQPDIQYIVSPSLAPHLPDALAIGLRIVARLERPREPASGGD